MSRKTYAELFAGAGGLSAGLEMAGWTAFAHAEIEPHARAVLRKHWPETRLDGDVTQLNGADYRGITLLSGGSPCQDLSVAGKRAGMVEGSGTRSSLYFEQVRIWQESEAPYFLWENVLGALSSNNGRDFAAVLSALVGASVPVPDDGWRSAGVASGPAGVAAWRVLDAQYFGVPQRRRRVFVLGARAGGVDVAEVLALSESVSGDSATSGTAGQNASSDVGAGVAGAFGIRGTLTGRSAEKGGPGGLGDTQSADEPMWTLAASEQHAVCAFPLELSNQGSGGNIGFGEDGDPSRTRGCATPPGVVTYEWWGHDARFRETETAPNLTSRQDNGQGNAMILRMREGQIGHPSSKGPLLSAERSLTLGTSNDQVVFTKQQQGAFTDAANVASTFAARDQASLNTDLAVGQLGIPRRLTPRECERLMGWQDGWTANGVNESGTAYPLSDTARYKLCGNGVASPVAAWIGFRLVEALRETP